MVGGVHVGVQREGALPLTVVGCIAFRCDDPVLPREGSEARPQSDHAEAPSRVPPLCVLPLCELLPHVQWTQAQAMLS